METLRAGCLGLIVWAGERSVCTMALLATTLVPIALFTVWMHAHTGLWIPSSVSARQLMGVMGDTYLRPQPTMTVIERALGLLFEGPRAASRLALATQALLLVVGGAALLRTRTAFVAAYVLVGVAMAAGLAINNPGYYLMRYAMPMLPLSAVMLTS